MSAEKFNLKSGIDEQIPFKEILSILAMTTKTFHSVSQ